MSVMRRCGLICLVCAVVITVTTFVMQDVDPNVWVSQWLIWAIICLVCQEIARRWWR